VAIWQHYKRVLSIFLGASESLTAESGSMGIRCRLLAMDTRPTKITSSVTFELWDYCSCVWSGSWLSISLQRSLMQAFQNCKIWHISVLPLISLVSGDLNLWPFACDWYGSLPAIFVLVPFMFWLGCKNMVCIDNSYEMTACYILTVMFELIINLTLWQFVYVGVRGCMCRHNSTSNRRAAVRRRPLVWHVGPTSSIAIVWDGPCGNVGRRSFTYL